MVRESPQEQALNALTTIIYPTKSDNGKAITLSYSNSESNSDDFLMCLLNALRGQVGSNSMQSNTK